MQRTLKTGSPKSIDRSLDCAVRRRPSMVAVRLCICYLALMAVALFTLGVQGCPRGGGTTSSIPPTATFTASKTAVHPGGLVLFSDTSAPGSKPITSWFWDFGDGSTSTEKNPLHSYTVSGRFTVALTVTSSIGSNTLAEEELIAVHPAAAEFLPGDEVSLVTETVGSTGALIRGPAGTPIDGVQVAIPDGALAKDTAVTLGYNEGQIEAAVAASVGPILSIDAGDQVFDFPVDVSFPTPKDGNVSIPVQLFPNGELAPCLVTDISEEMITFSTLQGGLLTVVTLDLPFDVTGQTKADFKYDTMFRPKGNGFWFPNYPHEPAEGGRCYGMAMFPEWFWQNVSQGNGLWYRYRDPLKFVQPVPGLNGLTEGPAVATRAMLAAQQSNIDSIMGTIGQIVLTPSKQFELIVGAMILTGRPVVIGFQQPPTYGSHAVLAYKFENDKIWIYDSNYPYKKELTPDDPKNGNNRIIEFTGFPLSHFYYSSQLIPLVGVLGNSSTLSTTEPYENIFADAESHFRGRSYATIDGVSPANHTKVPEGNVVLKGRVRSGQVLAGRLEIVNSLDPGKIVSVSLPLTGEFEATLPAMPGENVYDFLTYGNSWTGPLAVLNLFTEKEIWNNHSSLIVGATKDDYDPFTLNVARHLSVTPDYVTLNAGDNYKASLSVRSTEPGGGFPLRWTVSSISDNRIKVSPKQSNGAGGNETNVSIWTTATNSTFNATVEFTNQDNPADIQTVNVNVRPEIPLPELPGCWHFVDCTTPSPEPGWIALFLDPDGSLHFVDGTCSLVGPSIGSWSANTTVLTFEWTVTQNNCTNVAQFTGTANGAGGISGVMQDLVNTCGPLQTNPLCLGRL